MKKIIFYTSLVIAVFTLSSIKNNSVFAQDLRKNRLIYSPKVFDYYSLDYNRVEGLFLGGKYSYSNKKLPQTWLDIEAGYGFKSKDIGYSASIIHGFNMLYSTTAGISIFDEIRSNESEMVKNYENTLSTLLLRRDYRDYYRVKGINAGFFHKIKTYFSSEFNLRFIKYSRSINNDPWSMFFKERIFRDNPEAAENEEIVLKWTLDYSNLENEYVESNYWRFKADFEKELKNFDYTGFDFLISRTQLSWGSQTLKINLNGRFKFGTTVEQHLFDLGGIGTLRGYGFKEFTGNRMLYLESTYFFGGDLMQKLPLHFIPFYSTFKTSVFFETGMTWIHEPFITEPSLTGYSNPNIYERETGTRFKDIKSDIGVSLYFLNFFDGTFRLDTAVRLDGYENPVKTTFRLIKTF
ncbi:DUF5686 family protein [candidate division KSB1 bacterium]